MEHHLSQLLEPELLTFFGWWQIAVCLFAFASLLAIWWHLGRKREDYGQVWLALSVLCWSFSGGVEVYYAHQIKVQQQSLVDAFERGGEEAEKVLSIKDWQEQALALKATMESMNFQRNGLRSILSLLNSFFILLALPWFRHIPPRIEGLVKGEWWLLFVLVPFLGFMLATVGMLVAGQPSRIVNSLDVLYGILFTLPFLGWILKTSFENRGLKSLAWLSVLCILFTAVAQAYKLFAPDADLTLLSSIFKTSLIMLFFALALSWVKELAEFVIPAPHRMHLSFGRAKTASGRYRHSVQLKGFPWPSELAIPITRTRFELLLRFAHRKDEEGEGWLDIRPKNDPRANRQYDINDANEYIRLIDNILEGVAGQTNGEVALSRAQLKQALFEQSDKRDGKIRLRLPAANITIPEELLS